MSFKRDGDDLSLLNKLKHQRVSELLGTHIPEDEAKLLSNGRLTCLICLSRPIFDTVAMLAKHRKGKKHLLELSRYIKRKQELELENVKKQQTKELTSAMTIQSIINSRILGPRDHFGDSSRGKINVCSRRRTLDLPTFISETPKLLLSETSPVSSATHVRKYLKTLHRKRSLDTVIDQMRENYGKKINKSEMSEGNDGGPMSELVSEPLKENVNRTGSPQAASSSLKKTGSSSVSNIELNRSLSGWIKDHHGDWVKDPDAEFDSDEDAPPATPADSYPLDHK